MGNDNRIRQFMTENFQYKVSGGAWVKFPGMLKITMTDDTGRDKIGPFPSGRTITLEGERVVEFGLEIVETHSDELELIDTLRGKDIALYFDTGEVDGDYVELFVVDVDAVGSLKITIPDKPIKFDLMFSASRQDDLAVVTPSTDLPADAHSNGTVDPVTGKNNYYVWVKTAVAP